MSKKKSGTDETKPRYVPPGSCTWCGHRPHAGECLRKIRTSTSGATGPCPCRHHELSH